MIGVIAYYDLLSRRGARRGGCNDGPAWDASTSKYEKLDTDQGQQARLD
jgi:hypothetical protein